MSPNLKGIIKWNRTHGIKYFPLENCPTKLNIGCGFDKKLGFLNVDIDPSCNPDVLLDRDGSLEHLPRNYFDYILARDVLEHFPRSESLRNLLLWNELLTFDGNLKIVTTDILSVAAKMNHKKEFAEHYGWTICLFGNQVQHGDFHHTGFTDITLEVMLSAAGFDVVSKEFIDEWCFDWTMKKTESWQAFLKEQEKSSDLEFLKNTYEHVFLRTLDEQGKTHFLSLLKQGCSRRLVYLELASCPEALFVRARQLGK